MDGCVAVGSGSLSRDRKQRSLRCSGARKRDSAEGQRGVGASQPSAADQLLH